MTRGPETRLARATEPSYGNAPFETADRPSGVAGTGGDAHAPEALRGRVRSHLEAQGFRLTSGGAIAAVVDDKARIRALHATAVLDQRERSRPALARKEDSFLERLVPGLQLDPRAVTPALVPIEDRRSDDALLWRWCTQHWSVPVSAGYGRRLRFLVVDRAHNDAVMGVIGLGDPVMALAARDNSIGWHRDARLHGLVNVMDAFVLGAVPPYRELLGGKLVALLTGANEVREAFSRRYGHKKTLIAERDPGASLAVVTTTSALGRSSVYNRLTRSDGTLAMEAVGYTKGTGDFHLSGELYRELSEFAKSLRGHASERHERWTGTGFRNRREVLHLALAELGFDSRALRQHGVRREVYVNRLARNSFEWLRGEDAGLDWIDQDVASISAWWVQRWLLRRAESDHRYQTFEPEHWRLFGASVPEAGRLP